MLQKKRAQRHIPDQIRRFKLFLSMTEILHDPGLKMAQNNSFTILSLATDQRFIKIVLAQDGIGIYRFISIMEHKARRAPKGSS